MSMSEPGIPPAGFSMTGLVESFSNVKEFFATAISVCAPWAPVRVTLMSFEEMLKIAPMNRPGWFSSEAIMSLSRSSAGPTLACSPSEAVYWYVACWGL
jgi:hypothetical protein